MFGIDIEHQPDIILVRARVADVPPERIAVDIRRDALTLAITGDDGVVAREEVPLASPVDVDRVMMLISHGVLQLFLPKRPVPAVAQSA